MSSKLTFCSVLRQKKQKTTATPIPSPSSPKGLDSQQFTELQISSAVYHPALLQGLFYWSTLYPGGNLNVPECNSLNADNWLLF